MILARGFVYLYVLPAVWSLRCYVCDNSANGACGEYFKMYQFKALNCPGSDFKCGKQTQPPLPGGWVGVIRSCYQMNSLPGINESDGCHHWTLPADPDNFTATLCFCSEDMCNRAGVLKPTFHVALVLAISVLMCR
ncbi:uncharacterized protein LOC121382238 [Gigantopelta aegis]|uniref:uncharacterized protein LOC121382238 n=1 Tax=Gigantopelta aegis TaxID=1735272 RepID=UPI001B88C892|nr:uncharacterized protein LOC121382238 [Gigantopelta aegis]